MHRRENRLIWPPEPGWFRLRLVRGGWQVPCQIVHQDGLWWAIVDGEAKAANADPACAEDVERIWHYGTAIMRHEFDYLEALRAFAPPDHPARNPLVRIDPRTLTPQVPQKGSFH
jgi:hypothetical protein